MKRKAVISEDGKYRYLLTRDWSTSLIPDTKRDIMFIGLNPSTADATIDDPTIRRLISFSKGFGYRRMMMLNLFAFRATHPEDMFEEVEPIGAEADLHIKASSIMSDKVVFCWGNLPEFCRERMEAVIQLIPEEKRFCFGYTTTGFPKHPLYLPKTSKLIKYSK